MSYDFTDDMIEDAYDSVLDDVTDDFANESELEHYGVKRRSGRYPWGSGDSPFQSSGDFLSRVDELKKAGFTEKQILEAVKMDSTTEYRTAVRYAKHLRRDELRAKAISMQGDGYSNSEIARRLGFENESSIRALLNETTAQNKNQVFATADFLKNTLKEKHIVDIGEGVERELNLSATQLREAVYALELDGYKVYGFQVPQASNPQQKTTIKVVCEPDITYSQVRNNLDQIKTINEYTSDDGGTTFRKVQYPTSINSNRVMVRYNEEGGILKDGVIELRRGVEDLNLGKSHYAQVRILVDGTHYLKGMAMYTDDIPDGVDVIFNTNKTVGTPKNKVFKEISLSDPNNPFGAEIKANGQSIYVGKDGKPHLSAINKLKEEGDWDSMSRNLSSQFLSKQPRQLIKNQLNLTYADLEEQYASIMSITNPTVRKKMLLDFADACDSSTSKLQAAALPRQSTQVLLPFSKMKDNEIYAPNYRDGEQVALIRYPHAGTFEIPVLTVNNRNKSAQQILGKNLLDAVGINPKVAEQLSGADFDGDQVVVIPTGPKVQIAHTKYLEDLKGFDPKTQYAYKEGMKVMTKANVQKEMGTVSNLITDMTLRGAPLEDVAKAVKHSMVVIDAYKHKLDYKRSEIDNEISRLKERYQMSIDPDTGEVKVGGASTLISKVGSTIRIPERQGSGRIDPETGKLVYKESGGTHIDRKTGKVVPNMIEVKKGPYVDDARTLSSGHPVEEIYADYANKVKAMANRARKEYLVTPEIQYSREAEAKYQFEVDSLKARLNTAALNAPRERQAQILAYTKVKAIQQANPNLEKKELKKIRSMAIADARATMGAGSKGRKIYISDAEWEAIQSGAVSPTTLKKILRYADEDRVKSLAMPKQSTTLSAAKIAKLNAMLKSGYSNQEIADALGYSVSTIIKYMKE